MFYRNLYQKIGGKTTVGLIGTGHFGIAVLIQARTTPYLQVMAVADKSAEALKKAFKQADIKEEEVLYCGNMDEAMQAWREKKIAALTDPQILIQLPLDTVVEATGNPEAGAVHALAAIEKKKNIVLVNKETDSCVGPILKKKADEHGVICTPVDGDQHGALIQMVDWAREIGLEVVSAGKSRDAEFTFDRSARTVTIFADGITVMNTITVHLTEEECTVMETGSQKEMKDIVLKRKEILKELDERGGFDLCEMVIAANATGLVPDVPLLHDYILRTPELPKVLCGEENGGLLKKNGVIEVVTNLHETGEAGLGGGVFLNVTCENDYSAYIMATKGCLSSDDGKISLIYRPYHLCGVEAGTTLVTCGMCHLSTGSVEYEQRFDMVQEAAEDLKAGDCMGNDHDIRMRTYIIPATHMKDDQPIPAHLLNGRRLICDVPKGTMITYGMVEKPENSILWKLRKEQEMM